MTAPNATKIQRAVAAYFKLNVHEVVYPSRRDEHIVMARHIAWWLERKAGLSFPGIARLYGRVDHTTVLAAVNHMRERIANGDARYLKAIAYLEAKLDFDANTPAQPTVAEQVTALRVEVAELKKAVDELKAESMRRAEATLMRAIKGGRP